MTLSPTDRPHGLHFRAASMAVSKPEVSPPYRGRAPDASKFAPRAPRLRPGVPPCTPARRSNGAPICRRAPPPGIMSRMTNASRLLEYVESGPLAADKIDRE